MTLGELEPQQVPERRVEQAEGPVQEVQQALGQGQVREASRQPA
jgi:hypothetical protein